MKANECNGEIEPNQVSNRYWENTVGGDGKVYYWDMMNLSSGLWERG